MSTEHKETISSPRLFAVHPEKFGHDPYYQHELVSSAVRKYLHDPFERGRDLRGHSFRVTLHQDGLHVTIEDVTEDE